MSVIYSRMKLTLLCPFGFWNIVMDLQFRLKETLECHFQSTLSSMIGFSYA